MICIDNLDHKQVAGTGPNSGLATTAPPPSTRDCSPATQEAGLATAGRVLYILVAHNASFDMSVLRQACAAEKLPVPGNDYVCTLALARQASELPSYKLPDVAAEFGVRLTAHHDASADARCAAQVAVAMARRHGHDKLEQLAQSFHIPVGHLAA